MDEHLRDEQVAMAARIGAEVAARHAAEVDREARFPHEAIEALRKARLLSAAVPARYGGAGASVADLGAMCTALGRHCASTAMVVAMHHIQVACLARHGGDSPFFARYLAGLCETQALIASATSEVGVGGDLRRSIAAVEGDPAGGRVRLNKACSTLSYGAQADAILATARRDPAAAPGDQVLVLVEKADYTLADRGTWDTLGMRGTCSPGWKLSATVGSEQVLPEAFADAAPMTMVPYSHLLWASCWLGLATDAVGRVRAGVQSEARKKPGTVPPTALRLSELTARLHTLRALVNQSVREFDDLCAAPDLGRAATSSVAFAIRMNTLKVAGSRMLLEIVTDAMSVAGISGYRNDSPGSLGRHLRDACSALLMIGNDRIHATNAALLLVSKGE